MEQKQLKDMSDIEIKAAISDLRDRIDADSYSIQVLRGELAKRNNALKPS